MNGGTLLIVGFFIIILVGLFAMVSDPDSAANRCYDKGGIFMANTYQCIGEDK